MLAQLHNLAIAARQPKDAAHQWRVGLPEITGRSVLTARLDSPWAFL